MLTIIHERPNGDKIEYRRSAEMDADPTIIRLEHRQLRRDGHPHHADLGVWYPVSDEHSCLLGNQWGGRDVIDQLGAAKG